jgi:hypothetical protein
MNFNRKKETLRDEETLFATHYGHAFTPGQLNVCAARGEADAGAEHQHHDFYTEQSGSKHAEQYHQADDNDDNDYARPNDDFPDDIR